eukprot:1273967-Prymnesium_polylepis.1
MSEHCRYKSDHCRATVGPLPDCRLSDCQTVSRVRLLVARAVGLLWDLRPCSSTGIVCRDGTLPDAV